MNDALCNAWKDKCFYDGINGSTTWRTYMKEKCQKTCGYCSGIFKKSAVYLLQVYKINGVGDNHYISLLFKIG